MTKQSQYNWQNRAALQIKHLLNKYLNSLSASYLTINQHKTKP